MWYLDRVRNLSGTKIHHYVHEVRGGLPLDDYSPAAYLTEVPQRKLRRPLGKLTMELIGSEKKLEDGKG